MTSSTPYACHCQNAAPHDRHDYYSLEEHSTLRCDGVYEPRGTAAQALIADHDALVWDTAFEAVREALEAFPTNTPGADDLIDRVFQRLGTITNPFKEN